LDLETSELDLREAFHSIGADVSAIPRYGPPIKRSSSIPPRRSRRNGRYKKSRQPHSSCGGSGQTTSAACCAVAAIQRTGVLCNNAPLAGELQAKLGMHRQSAPSWNRFEPVLRTFWQKRPRSSSSETVPDDKIKTLPPDLRARVNRLAASMLSSLQHDSSDYVKSLSPVLDDMAHDLNILLPETIARVFPVACPGRTMQHWPNRICAILPKMFRCC